MSFLINIIASALTWFGQFFVTQIFGLFSFFIAKGFIKKVAFGVQLTLSGAFITTSIGAFLFSIGILVWAYNQLSDYLNLLQNSLNGVGGFSCLAYALNLFGILSPLASWLNTLYFLFSMALIFKLYFIYRKLLKFISDEFAKLGIIASI